MLYCYISMTLLMPQYKLTSRIIEHQMKMFEYVFTLDKKFPHSQIDKHQKAAQGADEQEAMAARQALMDAGRGFSDENLPQWTLITDDMIIALDNVYTDHLQKQSSWFGIADAECASTFVTYVDAAKTRFKQVLKKKKTDIKEEQDVLAQVEAKMTYIFDDAALIRIGDLPIITPSVPMDIAKWLSNGALSVAEVSLLHD